MSHVLRLLTLELLGLLLLPTISQAEVAHDASSESHAGTTSSASEASFTWNHTPVGTPRGVIIGTCDLSSATQDATSVIYGGSAMTAVTGGAAADTAGEPGNMTLWFLGSAVPTGVQAVVVNRNNNANKLYAVAVTVTALSDTATHDAGIVLLQEDGTTAEQSVTDGSPGTNSVRYAFGYSGDTTNFVAGANSTALQSVTVGSAQKCNSARETTAGQGARSVGFSDGTSDDRAIVHVAIKETGGGSTCPKTLTLMGAGC